MNNFKYSLHLQLKAIIFNKVICILSVQLSLKERQASMIQLHSKLKESSCLLAMSCTVWRGRVWYLKIEVE